MSDSIVSLAATDIVSSPEDSELGQHVHPSPVDAVYYIRLSSHYEVSARPEGQDFQTLNTNKRRRKKNPSVPYSSTGADGMICFAFI